MERGAEPGRGADQAGGGGPFPVTVVALSGGIGGAKLALGLARTLRQEELIVVANTGDDFEHLGLSISPDLDTLMYTLAGIANPETGWGRRAETWSFMTALAELGGATWFRLGDADLATHVERTRRLKTGETLSRITDDFCRRLGVRPRILPMTNDRVRTRVKTRDGWIEFQDYFVRQRCEPAVTAVAYDGAASARPQPEFLAALKDPGLRAVVICPSNPFLSVEPILAPPGVRDALRTARAPVVAVSPIVDNRSLKGPTAKMMRELGIEASAAAVGRRYGDLIDGYVIDHSEGAIALPGVTVARAGIVMSTLDDRDRLATQVVAFAATLANARTRAGGEP
jgi:LPPG:FO 2-phospho-L-lactate transferase